LSGSTPTRAAPLPSVRPVPMSQPAIEVTGLSKRYLLEHESRHDTLRDTLHHGVRHAWRRLRGGKAAAREEFWALRDVSFRVEPGEVLGIVGRNGAGKSTLLKILSRITEPTAGRVTLRGRVASLLEVGTGFHPDLSGRENIYLNGAILGMRRSEIRRKFDQIVAFAEVDRFLDTPVKRYSSGMYVRLAFAVAAHLEPEILIIDEVLAVGDAAFQKKCLGKMEEVARGQGRTILFVSHNEASVRRLCSSALLLHHGGVQARGPTEQVLATQRPAPDAGLAGLRTDLVRDHGRGAVILRSLRVGGDGPPLRGGSDQLIVHLETEGASDQLFAVEITVHSEQLAPLFLFAPHLSSGERPPLHRAGVSLRVELPLPPLASGTYFLTIQLVRPLEEVHAHYGTIASFRVEHPASGLHGWRFEQSRNQGCLLLEGRCHVGP
jgi:lipopolysaccharide transport system ATP-binding protein